MKVLAVQLCLTLCDPRGLTDGSDSKESAIPDTRVQSLGSEDPLEKGMTAHSSILAWRI